MPSIHPNPRKRFGLEIARFTIYLTVPVVAIAIGNDPKTMNGLLSRFNFVEYPPESEKLPSGDEIVKRLQEREARRLRSKIDSATVAIDEHIAALPSKPITTQTLKKQEETTSTVVKKGRGWFGWFRRGGPGSNDTESLPK